MYYCEINGLSCTISNIVLINQVMVFFRSLVAGKRLYSDWCWVYVAHSMTRRTGAYNLYYHLVRHLLSLHVCSTEYATSDNEAGFKMNWQSLCKTQYRLPATQRFHCRRSVYGWHTFRFAAFHEYRLNTQLELR